MRTYPAQKKKVEVSRDREGWKRGKLPTKVLSLLLACLSRDIGNFFFCAVRTVDENFDRVHQLEQCKKIELTMSVKNPWQRKPGDWHEANTKF